MVYFVQHDVLVFARVWKLKNISNTYKQMRCLHFLANVDVGHQGIFTPLPTFVEAKEREHLEMFYVSRPCEADKC